MWLKEIDEKLCEPPKNYRTPEGKWIVCFHQSPRLMQEYGWRDWSEEEIAEFEQQHPDPPPVPRNMCTKYELVTCLQTHFPDLLARLREAYASNQNLQFFWNSVLNLDRENVDFQSIVATLGITESELDEIFQKI